MLNEAFSDCPTLCCIGVCCRARHLVLVCGTPYLVRPLILASIINTVQVHCVFGDKRMRSDLKRAGIQNAYCVVVLTERRKCASTTASGIKNSLDPDADVILSAKDIMMLSGESEKQHMIVQLHGIHSV